MKKGGGLKRKFLNIFVIILIALSAGLTAQNLRNLVPPRAKYLYEYKDIYLSRLRDSLNTEIHSVKPDRNNIHNTVDEIFYRTIRYNLYKYSLTDRFDTLKTLANIKENLDSSSYFQNRIGRWDDSSILKYISFGIEYYILKEYFSDFTLGSFRNTDVYKDLVKRLEKESVTSSEIDSILVRVSKVRFEPVHFYYKPHSIEEQMKADRFDIKKFNFTELKEFSIKYADVLERAEKKYNVNREIIVAVLRKETNLGKVPLKYNPFEVLLAQSLYAVENPAEDVEERTKNLKRIDRLKNSAGNSLYHIIKYALDNSHDPSEMESNFVGALGFTQFMPFNLHLAVDGGGDGRADLSEMNDAIMSIANFLNHNGWNRFYELNRSNKSAIEKFILRYNSSVTYAESVFEIALELKKIMK
ncbi:MAG: lytic murein transglycosylase [Candidatus Delongbacteria bacterium]|nr:lytic murein transglycosylase [Candidatus Delongbacteria bacterium]